MQQQWAGSLEFHRWTVTAVKNGQPYDPTNDPVEFALTTETDGNGEPVAPTSGFVGGVWENPAPNVYVAAVLVGPAGAVNPASGTYFVWMRVTDSPEIPLRLVDTLQVS